MKTFISLSILICIFCGCKKDPATTTNEPKIYPLTDTWWQAISQDQFGTDDSMRILLKSDITHTAQEYTVSHGMVGGNWYYSNADSTELTMELLYLGNGTLYKNYSVYYFKDNLLVMGYFGVTYVFVPYLP